MPVMKLAASGRLNLKDLVSKTFRIEDINEAFAYAASGEGMKTFVSNG